MVEYQVKMTPRARRDLDGIFAHIAEAFHEPETAVALIDKLEEGLLSLETLPYRCPERRRGIYADKGYR